MSEKKYSRHIEKVRYRTKIFEPYQPHILNLYKVNDFQRPEKSAAYDYLEEKLGSLPGTKRSFRNYINFLVETEQLKFNDHKRIYSPVAELPYGKQLQIDFREYRTQRGLKLYIFAAVLSASRYKYCALQDRPFTTLDLIHHLLDCFDYLGGIPEELVIDQDKVMIASENRGDIIYKGIKNSKSHINKHLGKIDKKYKDRVIELKKEHPLWGCRTIAFLILNENNGQNIISPSGVQKVLEKAGLWGNKLSTYIFC